MQRFKRKNPQHVRMENYTDLKYLFDSLSDELSATEKKLDDISYQIEFFGISPELRAQKEDCEIMLLWIQNQFDDIKKALFQVNVQNIVH